MPAFPARSIAYAPGLSVMSASQAAGIVLAAIASITAWKFDPLPDASTAMRFFMDIPADLRDGCTLTVAIAAIPIRADNDLDLDNAPPVHLQDNECHPAFANLHLLARVLGEMAEPVDDQTPDRLVGVVGREVEVHPFVDVFDPHLGIDNKDAGREFLHFRFLLVVLVHDIANKFLEDILDGHDPDKTAVLVDHDCHQHPVDLEFL